MESPKVADLYSMDIGGKQRGPVTELISNDDHGCHLLVMLLVFSSALRVALRCVARLVVNLLLVFVGYDGPKASHHHLIYSSSRRVRVPVYATQGCRNFITCSNPGVTSLRS